MCQAIVVDDDRVTLTVMARTIENSGFTCHAVSSGAEALKLIAEDPEISVLVTDLKMPDMDGMELFAQVREIREDIRGILCSAHVSYSNINDYIQADFDDCIAKPIDGPNLVQALRRSMDKHGRWKRRSHPKLPTIKD